jgi:hypothetical protein
MLSSTDEGTAVSQPDSKDEAENTQREEDKDGSMNTTSDGARESRKRSGDASQ